MKQEWKKDNTPVTETDLTINRLVIEALQEKFPDHTVVGEEESRMVQGSEYAWVCDPVDGTIPFSHGIPVSTFSLALVHDGKPIVGVVYDPFMDRLFFAEKGKGAELNNKPIHVSDTSILNLKAVGLEIGRAKEFQLGEVRLEFRQKGAKVFTLAAYIYQAMLVASGEFIAALYTGHAAHDAASVKVIVEEAGGKVTDMFGQEQRYDQAIRGCLATNGIVHEEILAIIQKILAKTKAKELHASS